MSSLQNFLQHFDRFSFLMAVFSAVAALLCLTVHELSHGAVAYVLGDPTAKDEGRLTLNPIKHIDPLGLLLMITAHVGWAKPVPVDMRYFKHPKRDMALTALAGPASNFLLAWVFLLLANLLGHLLVLFSPSIGLSPWGLLPMLFLINAAVLSIGLGVFNLFPIPPLDGSKILFSFLPDKIYYTILRYERYIMILMLALVWVGVLDKPLSFLMVQLLRGLCFLSGMDFENVLILYSLT
ncbi:MAG: site-2 protease family protein [Oscillospiraceae bacterium]